MVRQFVRLLLWKEEVKIDYYIYKEFIIMKIQVAGPGCAKCQETEKNVRDACTRVGYNKSRFTMFTVILKLRRYFGLVIFS
jgi:hypothetical protein